MGALTVWFMMWFTALLAYTCIDRAVVVNAVIAMICDYAEASAPCLMTVIIGLAFQSS